MIHVVAAISMFLDHLKYAGFDSAWFPIIGRLAAVHYLTQCGLGLTRTKNTRAYAGRLLLTALIFSAVFYFLFHQFRINVVFIMAFAAYFLHRPYLKFILPVICFFSDYGLAGLLTVISANKRNFSIWLLALVFLNGVSWFASLLTVFYGLIVWRFKDSPQVGPRYWPYYFYPAHLFLVAAVPVWSRLVFELAGRG